MPVPDLPLAEIQKAILMGAQTPPAASQSRQAEELIVEFLHQEVDLVNQTALYTGGVKAIFGPTTITCDELLLDRKNKIGTARGKVHLSDPEGWLDAENLVFDYAHQTGSAEKVYMEAEVGLKLRAARADIGKDAKGNPVWTLYDVWLTPSRLRPPEFAVSARKIVVRPGRSAKATKPGIEVFGNHILTMPYYTLSLDDRATGFRIPTATYRRGEGFGMSWTSIFLIGEQTSLSMKSRFSQQTQPSTSVEIAGTPIRAERFTGKLGAHSDLGDRFYDSYTDNIGQLDPQNEIKALKQPRMIYSVGSYWNTSVIGRAMNSDSISKPFDASVEFGGALGPRAAAMAQVRFQQIRPDAATPYKSRTEINLIGHSGYYPLASGISLGLRVDSTSTLGNGSNYSWLRGSASLLYRPNPLMDAMVGITRMKVSGTPQFAIDEIKLKDFLFARTDFHLGPLNAGFMVKYDEERHKIGDFESGFSLAAGSFEPYIISRREPHQLIIGLRLRTAPIMERLSKRQIERTVVLDGKK